MKTYRINTLGCKVNQFESEVLAEELEAAGYVPARSGQPADLCIVNTCTVTRKASTQSRQAVRALIRQHPQAHIVATGCYAQTTPEALERIPGVDAVIPHSKKALIARKFTGRTGNRTAVSSGSDQGTAGLHERPTPTRPGGRTRPFLKIQDGCEAFCTYCIVPHARGGSVSMPPPTVMAHLAEYARAGYREVVLTGIHMGCYGLDLTPPTTLSVLLQAVQEAETPDRIRLSSIEPKELTNDIIRLVASSPLFCDHFHIPLQSGDDNVLRRMHRPYTADTFKALVLRIQQALPDAAIGADVMVGFPGGNPQRL